MVGGYDADRKARATARALFARQRAMLASANLGDYAEVNMEVIGAEDMFGGNRRVQGSREVVLKMSARHRERKARRRPARSRGPRSRVPEPA